MATTAGHLPVLIPDLKAGCGVHVVQEAKQLASKCLVSIGQGSTTWRLGRFSRRPAALICLPRPRHRAAAAVGMPSPAFDAPGACHWSYSVRSPCTETGFCYSPAQALRHPRRQAYVVWLTSVAAPKRVKIVIQNCRGVSIILV